MGLPNSADVQKSVERLTEYYHVSVPLGGTLAAQDYLGNTTDNAGVPVPSATLDSARVTLSAADDGATSFTVHNETKNNTASFTLEADTYTEAENLDLYFSEDDELSVEVDAVTTPGDGLSLVLTFEVEPAPMN